MSNDTAEGGKADRPSAPLRGSEQGRAAADTASDTIPIATQIAEADTHADRAGLLLRAPFAVLLTEMLPLAAACARSGFSVGVDYLAVVEAALRATRQPDGDLPERHRASLQGYATMLARFAAGPDEATVAMMARHDAKQGRKNPMLTGTSGYDQAWAETKGEVDG